MNDIKEFIKTYLLIIQALNIITSSGSLSSCTEGDIFFFKNLRINTKVKQVSRPTLSSSDLPLPLLGGESRKEEEQENVSSHAHAGCLEFTD